MRYGTVAGHANAEQATRRRNANRSLNPNVLAPAERARRIPRNAKRKGHRLLSGKPSYINRFSRHDVDRFTAYGKSHVLGGAW